MRAGAFVVKRVCAARVLHCESGGNIESRSFARCSVGIRELSEHAHRRYPHRSSETEARTKSGRASFHTYRSWQWLQVRWLALLQTQVSTWREVSTTTRWRVGEIGLRELPLRVVDPPATAWWY